MQLKIKFTKLKGKSKARARASLEVSDGVFLQDILIIEGKAGYFIQWPERIGYSDTGKLIHFPLICFKLDETKVAYEEAILRAFLVFFAEN